MSQRTELLERLKRGPDVVTEAIAGVSEAELDYSPGPGRWSVRQVMCHLADSEMVAADRFRRVIAEDNPTLMGYDQEAWAAKLDYARRPIPGALETFRAARLSTYEILKDVPEAAYDRAGTHTEHGRITLQDLLQTYAEHAESHARQIERARQQYRQSRR